MLAFWPDVIRPLLAAQKPRSIVEIGSESGKMTSRLIELAEEIGAVVHAVDPVPGFDAEAWEQKFPERFHMHRLPSLVALGTIDIMDVVLIDGDHNWFTVFSELELIEQRAKDNAQPHPLVLLHDIAWPYGRRDLYYDPKMIPEEHRQVFARQGISITASELLPSGGFNAHLCNAVREGGAKNGVLTAVEDYLAKTDIELMFARIPAVFGLGILLPKEMAADNPELARLVRNWQAPEVESFIDRLEVARIAMMTGAGG
jgi:hypothetical protein